MDVFLLFPRLNRRDYLILNWQMKPLCTMKTWTHEPHLWLQTQTSPPFKGDVFTFLPIRALQPKSAEKTFRAHCNPTLPSTKLIYITKLKCAEMSKDMVSMRIITCIYNEWHLLTRTGMVQLALAGADARCAGYSSSRACVRLSSWDRMCSCMITYRHLCGTCSNVLTN